MIDIHSHVLPMVDDGAQSVEMALDMLIQAYENGTDEIVLTPHYAIDYNYVNPKDKIINLFHDLVRIVEHERIPIKLYLGTEYLMSSIHSFREHVNEIRTMNETRYLLIEFFFDVHQERMLELVDEVLNHHFIPIIAHAERFKCIQLSTSLAKELIDKGCVLQMNKGSILGEFGKYPQEAAYELLDQHYYSFVGSDTHHPIRRTANMKEAYRIVQHYYGTRYADDIFYFNAKDMLKDIDIRKG